MRGYPLLKWSSHWMASQRVFISMNEIILNVETTNNFISVLTLEQRGHLLTMLIKNAIGKEYKSSNKETDILINSYKNITLKSDKRNLYHTLYFIKISDNINGQCFLKIGITSNIENRYTSFKNNYLQITELFIKNFSTKKLALINESLVKKKYSHDSFKPKYKFGGNTECFYTYAQEYILNYLRTL